MISTPMASACHLLLPAVQQLTVRHITRDRCRGLDCLQSEKTSCVSATDVYNRVRSLDAELLDVDMLTNVDQYGSTGRRRDPAVGGASYETAATVYDMKVAIVCGGLDQQRQEISPRKTRHVMNETDRRRTTIDDGHVDATTTGLHHSRIQSTSVQSTLCNFPSSSSSSSPRHSRARASSTTSCPFGSLRDIHRWELLYVFSPSGSNTINGSILYDTGDGRDLSPSFVPLSRVFTANKFRPMKKFHGFCKGLGPLAVSWRT